MALTDTDRNRLVGKVDAFLVSRGQDEWLTPSQVARRVKCETWDARDVLQSLVRTGFAISSGNGAWTRYHAK